MRVHLGKTNFYFTHRPAPPYTHILYTRTVQGGVYKLGAGRGALVCVRGMTGRREDGKTGSSSGRRRARISIPAVGIDEQLVRALDQPSVKSRRQNVSFGTLCSNCTGCPYYAESFVLKRVSQV